MLHGPSGPEPTSQFEHSSIPATVKKIFNLKEFLTKRDAWAGTFEGVLTRNSPRTDCPGIYTLTHLHHSQSTCCRKLTQYFISLSLFLLNVYTYMAAVTLVEPAKLRDVAPKDEGKLSEFQEELVQLAAVLNGDHRKDTYPDKLVENMTVAEAAKYVQVAFKKFKDECEKAREGGADEDEIVVCATNASSSSKSIVHKLVSCFICDN